MVELARSTRTAPDDCPGAGSSRCAACAARPFSVCAAVPDADLARLEAIAETVRLDRGQALVREGDPGTCVYNVTAGALRLSRLTPDGRRAVLGFAFAGDFLGLDRAPAWYVTIEALEPAAVCRFPRARFETLLAERRELETALLARASDALAAAQAQVLALARKSALERLASFLLSLPASDPMRPPPAGHIRLPMTRQEIADHLGLTLETVSRSFTRLKRAGAIRQVSLTEVEVVSGGALARAAGS
jgi:CRP/FNR family transcriptional regulator